MTYEQAYAIWKGNSGATAPEYAEMTELVSKAIIKQIPKKPNGIYLPMCPTCNSEYGVRSDDYGDRPKCCTECGQKIDWSDNDDK